MTRIAGSMRTRAVDILRAERTWMRARDVRERLGLPTSLSSVLAPAIRDGEVVTQRLRGERYYLATGMHGDHPPPGPADQPAASRRFQLQPVWPPGFVPRLAGPMSSREAGSA